MEVLEQLQPVIDFVKDWAFPPFSILIMLLVFTQKKMGFLDFNKFRWLTAIVWGLLFATLQKWLAEPLGLVPVQSEWIPTIVMGIMSAVLAIAMYATAGKPILNKLSKVLDGLKEKNNGG